MKFLNYILLVFIILTTIGCQSKNENYQIVEISCGQCQFGLNNKKGCDLAIRKDNKPYFVDGVHIDDFGDAHDKKSGFCEVIRNAKITGKLLDNRFQVSSIELLKIN